MTTPSLFSHRDFRLLLVGQTTSQAGAQVSGVAIPLLAVLTLQASPFELRLVTATMRFLVMGAFPLGALLGGVLGELIGLRSALAVSGSLLSVAALPVHRALRHARETTDLSRWGADAG